MAIAAGLTNEGARVIIEWRLWSKKGGEDGEAEIDFLLLSPPSLREDANDCSIESERRIESAKNART